ncbi:SGNH/GDSL hydrolase family protein [Inquilinus sp. KBS0705]|nr:SGNH/GDSL hydrolase family protein [Inquilinus sp. KBS0705]
MKFLVTILFSIGIFNTCKPVANNPNALTYLALGDSYTIGESEPQEQSFPYQLSARLNAAGKATNPPDIIAVTGWTTGDLIGAIKDRDLGSRKYDIVTLLIGVNNQYRGYSTDDYRQEFIDLLNTAISHAKGGKAGVFVLSIPDWGLTPFAGGRDRAQISKEIDQFNAINKQETEKAGVTYVDITPSSRLATTDIELIAGDGLHASGKMYSMWVNELLKVVKPK